MYSMVTQNKIKRYIAYELDGPYRNDKTLIEIGNFKAIASELKVEIEVIEIFLKELENLGVLRIVKPLNVKIPNEEVVVETYRETPRLWYEQ
jgi:hypothetical protein